MKKLLFIANLVLLSVLCQAQLNMQLQVSNEPYVPLTDYIVINDGPEQINNYSKPLPIGFTFKGFKANYDSLTVSIASLTLRGEENFIYYSFPLNSTDTIYESGVTGISQTKYQLVETSEGKVAKFEFENYDYTDYPNQLFSMQIWLHENEGIITWHFGSNIFEANHPIKVKPIVSYLGEIQTNANEDSLLYSDPYFLKGTLDSLYLVDDLQASFIGYPENGTKMTFTPNFTDIKENSLASQFLFSINESTLQVHYKQNQPFSVEVFNLNGQTITKNEKNMSNFSYNTHELSSGIYLIKLTTNEGTMIKKFMK